MLVASEYERRFEFNIKADSYNLSIEKKKKNVLKSFYFSCQRCLLTHASEFKETSCIKFWDKTNLMVSAALILLSLMTQAHKLILTHNHCFDYADYGILMYKVPPNLSH